MPDQLDAFDVITDPNLNARTASLKRTLALKLASQIAFDEWYSMEPEELAARLNGKIDLIWNPKGERYDPAETITRAILELSSSVDSEMLKILRDVGVGAPQFGVPGIGVPQTNVPVSEAQAPHTKRGVFRR